MNPEIPPTTSYQSATVNRRIIHFIIDRCLAVFIAYVIMVIAIAARYLVGIPGDSDVTVLIGNFVFGFVYFFYYFIGEFITGRTLGKNLTNTQVVSVSGIKPTFAQILERTLVRLIPFVEITALFSKQHIGLHDHISKTRVVQTASLPVQMQPHLHSFWQIVTFLLLLSLPGALVGHLVYEALTGGERFDLPKKMPADLRLTEYNVVPLEDGRAYYVLTYQGQNRTIQITRTIAGYDFDPDDDCSYTMPTKRTQVGLKEPVSSRLTCTEISKTKFVNEKPVSVAEVSSTETDPVITSITPDFYIHITPHRYAIKALSGDITREEVLSMAEDITEITEADLKKQAAGTPSK